MTKILITGATGFVGKQIMKSFAGSDVELFPVVRVGKEDLVSKLPNVSGIISTFDLFSENEFWWENQCSGIDIVIHAAWYAVPGQYLQATQNMDCLYGSLSLAKGAVNAGVKKFLGIGTCFEYELSHELLSVETPLNPLTPYAAAKASLYLSLYKWLPLYSVQFSWCRLFYLYGEGEDDRRLAPYIRKQIASGEIVE
jgi:dTDP-6-deoxy-L-talose 4-dehydrogenase (NAD+)